MMPNQDNIVQSNKAIFLLYTSSARLVQICSGFSNRVNLPRVKMFW